MKSRIDLKAVVLAVGVVLGLLTITIAFFVSRDLSLLVGILGVVLFGRTSVALAKRFGATDQPQ